MPSPNDDNLARALDAIRPRLSKPSRKEARSNAQKIVSAVSKAFKAPRARTGKANRRQGVTKTGLIYGRIQSGKTRAMITSSALAFDKGFQVVVVITSNNNRLVGQTQQDFRNGLPGSIRVFSKTHFKKEIEQAQQILRSRIGGIVLVCSKGKTRLNQAIAFLKKTGAKQCAAVIFDDEGDQATLDTNTFKRSTQPLIKASAIHRLIHDPAVDSLRRALPRHVFVSVTGTPSGIVLQNIDNRSRPSFVELLEAGRDYVGGEIFFSKPDAKNNKLITLIDSSERIDLLKKGKNKLPDGLRKAIRLFLLAAAAANAKMSWPDDYTGYKLLCHPSVKNADQEKVAERIRNYLVDVTKALTDRTGSLYKDLRQSYESLKRQTATIPAFETLIESVRTNLPSREVLILNKNTTGDELGYSRYFNFLIGGNTLGRGLAIKNLLVTYYVREAQITQMDTMYQHARMFGYRKPTLPYTRVFLPPQLYERFRQIYISDEDLREFIETHDGLLKAFPVRIARDIRATRKCVLDARKVDILVPGKQIFPNYPFFRASVSERITARVINRISQIFPTYATDGRIGRQVTTDEAIDIVSLIRTGGTNAWSDKKIPTILSYLRQQFKTGVLLKYRTAKRTAGDPNGLLEQGVLEGPVVTADASRQSPVLWIFKTTFERRNKPSTWNGSPFIYPTLVLPKKAELVVFNKS